MIDNPAPERDLKRRLAALRDRSALARHIREACFARGVHYDVKPGKRIPISVMTAPTLLTPSQVTFLHRLSEAINLQIRRLPALWIEHEAVREMLPFSDGERRWIESCWRPEHANTQTIVTRNDLDMPRQTSRTVAFETNGCSIGGIYYAGECSRIIDDHVMKDPEFATLRKRLSHLMDACEVAARLIEDHARLLGAPSTLSIGILENRDWDTGITEMPSFAQFLTRRGHRVTLGDPRSLETGGGTFRLDGTTVDILYRNMQLSDFVSLEAEGAGLNAMREAFRANRVVSTLAGDFDQKSAWEVLTTSRTRHLLPREHRSLLQRHLLWTRLLRPTTTEDPKGREVDLVPFVRKNRRTLVLKPNQLCGGQGVTLGPHVSDAAWQRAVQRALREERAWVVQRFHRGTQKPFPGKGSKLELHYVTYGVISAPFGHGVLGRACQGAVVNVSRGGGLVALFTRKG